MHPYSARPPAAPVEAAAIAATRRASLVSSVETASTTFSEIRRTVAAMDEYRVSSAPAYRLSGPGPRRCLSASTASLNERVAITIQRHEAAEAHRVEAEARAAALAAQQTFVTALNHEHEARHHPHGTAAPRKPAPPPRTVRGQPSSSSANSAAPRAAPKRPPHPPPPQHQQPSPSSSVVTPRGSSKSDYAIARRLDAMLDTYRTDPVERAALEYRLKFYKKQQVEAKLTRTPRSHEPPPPFEPSVHLTHAVAAALKEVQQADAQPVVAAAPVSPTSAPVSPTQQQRRIDALAVIAKAKELEAAAEGDDRETLALAAIQREQCEAWFQLYQETRPQVQLKPTQEEIAAHNKAREEAHHAAALRALAVQRLTRELSTTDARRAASARRAAEQEAAHAAMERAMRWLVLSQCSTSMRVGFMRTIAIKRLMDHAGAVVQVLQRYFNRWRQPVMNAIRARLNFRRRVLWRRGQSAALFVGILLTKRKAVAMVTHFLSGVKRLGRIRLSVSLYHRQLVVCQRAVRRYFQFRYSRLQLLHLQWDTAEEEMLRQRQLTIAAAGAFAETAKRFKTLNKSQQAAKRAKDDRRVELKAKATLAASNMTDEERVREIVANDAKTHLETRKTPFTVRHKAILKYWGQLRRSYVRRAMEAQRTSRMLTSAASDTFSPVASMRSSSFRRGGSSANLRTLGGGKALPSTGSTTVPGSLEDLERRVTMPLLMPKDRLLRMVQHTQEEYAGLCIQQCNAAARLVVMSKQDPANYAEFRESLINVLFPNAEDELREFARRAKTYNENLFFSVKAVLQPDHHYVHL